MKIMPIWGTYESEAAKILRKKMPIIEKMEEGAMTMGLDTYIVMCKNKHQLENEGFWDNCVTGWKRDKYDGIDYTQPAEVYYARKFWDLYSPAARRFNLENGEWSDPLTKEDIEFLIDLATHNRDYFGGFDTVPKLCEILDNYDYATDAGMIFSFSGNY